MQVPNHIGHAGVGGCGVSDVGPARSPGVGLQHDRGVVSGRPDRVVGRLLPRRERGRIGLTRAIDLGRLVVRAEPHVGIGLEGSGNRGIPGLFLRQRRTGENRPLAAARVAGAVVVVLQLDHDAMRGKVVDVGGQRGRAVVIIDRQPDEVGPGEAGLNLCGGGVAVAIHDIDTASDERLPVRAVNLPAERAEAARRCGIVRHRVAASRRRRGCSGRRCGGRCLPPGRQRDDEHG